MLIIFCILLAGLGVVYSRHKLGATLAASFALVASAFVVPQTDLYDSFIQELAEGRFELIAFLYAGLTSIFLGPFVAMLHMALYYMYWQKRAGADFITLEEYYFSRGLGHRIWTNAILYEIVFRLGLFSVLYWTCQQLLPDLLSLVVAIVLSSAAFTYYMWRSLCKIVHNRSAFFIYVCISYMALGVVAAYIYSLAGFLAALFVHLQFHLLWFPIQALMRAKRNGTLLD